MLLKLLSCAKDFLFYLQKKMVTLSLFLRLTKGRLRPFSYLTVFLVHYAPSIRSTEKE